MVTEGKRSYTDTRSQKCLSATVVSVNVVSVNPSWVLSRFTVSVVCVSVCLPTMLLLRWWQKWNPLTLELSLDAPPFDICMRALPLTSVADSCMMTDSRLYAPLQPCFVSSSMQIAPPPSTYPPLMIGRTTRTNGGSKGNESWVKTKHSILPCPR